MKVEFEMFEKPMPVNEDAIGFFRKIGNTFFLLIKEKRTGYISGMLDIKVWHEQRIVTLTVNPEFALFEREFVNFGNWSDVKILGYCKLEFPVGITVSV